MFRDGEEGCGGEGDGDEVRVEEAEGHGWGDEVGGGL